MAFWLRFLVDMEQEGVDVISSGAEIQKSNLASWPSLGDKFIAPYFERGTKTL
jgi:hypothetical protein